MSEILTLATRKLPKVQRYAGEGINLATVDFGAHRELHVTLQSLPRETPPEIVRRLRTVLDEHGATVVRHEVFGSVSARAESIHAMRQEFAGFDWPIMWIDDCRVDGDGITGMHVLAVAGTDVQTIRVKGQPVGRAFRNGPVRHCLLVDVTSSSPSLCREAQCKETFEKLEGALCHAGMTMGNAVRTWFYLNDILAWYDSFNAVRNGFYRERGILNGFVPASTGIGARNPSGCALIAGVWAVHGFPHRASTRVVPSPLQCSAMRYGSAFSRAVLVQEPNCRRLLVSGTASVGQTGRTARVGNLKGQISLTMEVVEVLLHSQDFKFSDVVRGTAYFKDIHGAETFDVYLAERDLRFLPLVRAQAHICRNELLFEIELDALSTEDGITISTASSP